MPEDGPTPPRAQGKVAVLGLSPGLQSVPSAHLWEPGVWGGGVQMSPSSTIYLWVEPKKEGARAGGAGPPGAQEGPPPATATEQQSGGVFSCPGTTLTAEH